MHFPVLSELLLLLSGNVFGGDFSAAATGFLVPTKDKGAISVFDMSKTPPSGPHDITSTSETWFYHRVLWLDMNSDGRLDALTARADAPLFGELRCTQRSEYWQKLKKLASGMIYR